MATLETGNVGRAETELKLRNTRSTEHRADKEQRSGSTIGKIIVCPVRMINGVSAAADSPALEVGELRKQPRVVQELHPIRHCQGNHAWRHHDG